MRSPHCAPARAPALVSIAWSSTCAPAERRSVAISAAPAAAPATMIGAQADSANVAPMAIATIAVLMRRTLMRSPVVMRMRARIIAHGVAGTCPRGGSASVIVAQERVVDHVAKAVDGQQVG